MIRDFYSNLRVDSERMIRNLAHLSTFGATPEGGVNRTALSEAHLSARLWFLEQVKQVGLATRVDGAGNHFAVLSSGNSQARTLLFGSHLDTVPNGGRFDGALGVIAALEVVTVIKENSIPLQRNLAVVDFTDEEGSLVDYLGSRALSGILDRSSISNPKGGANLFHQLMAHAGMDDNSLFTAAVDPASLAGYFELHIEQGARLIDAGIQIGLVTSIVGIRGFNLHYIGRADHAGTTPMACRRDATQGAAAFAMACRELVMGKYPDGVVNVGNMIFSPGVFNVVPRQVSVALEFRAGDDRVLDDMEEALIQLARHQADRFGLEIRIEQIDHNLPIALDTHMQALVKVSCETLGLSYTPIASGAGHDAMHLARVCPVGMIFIPSVEGISHSPKELSLSEDCINGANVLLQAVTRLALDERD
jgi:N-carbamoyl-L-amino-acid hydrolase